MGGIKRYIETFIATEACNFRCHYCYITQKRLFNNKVLKLQHSPQFIRKALSQERLGGTCLINLCAGGETLISRDIILLTKEFLEEGHFVSIVTNGVLSKRFDEICGFEKEPLQRLFFKFSFHYMELQRLNLMDDFFENIKKIRNAGCSFALELTPSDEAIPFIDEIKKTCMERLGALCHCTIARNDNDEKISHLSKHLFDEYKKIWNVFNSAQFDFKTNIFYEKRKEFCYAGDWSFCVNLLDGNYRQCYSEQELGNAYESIDKPLKFAPVGTACSLPHCYNGHAFLSLGVIPEMKTPTYAELRNRECLNGTSWLSETMVNFFSSKLSENNSVLSKKEQKQISGKAKQNGWLSKIKSKLRKISML